MILTTSATRSQSLWRKYSKDVSQASLIDRHANCHPITQSPGKIQKIHIDGSDPPFHQHQRELMTFKDLYQLRCPDFPPTTLASVRAGAFVVVKI